MTDEPERPIRIAARQCAFRDMDLQTARAAFDRAYVTAALWRAKGRRHVAADAMQVDRVTVNRILARGKCPSPT